MPPDDVDEQFKLLLANTANLIAYYPELATYLRDYPNAKLASSSDLDRVRADSLGGAFGGGSSAARWRAPWKGRSRTS